eukprot:TRINITY_DN12640_c0_g1_i1.p1 TRINITY_DN12640_c0_g1~~TRINITY_DN12640_c0_g1_i1.p1  ORF type:complete len:669 (+),score=205.29 TRINITY_DN12640_c0_g1_i1:101-2107(+)
MLPHLVEAQTGSPAKEEASPSLVQTNPVSGEVLTNQAEILELVETINKLSSITTDSWNKLNEIRGNKENVIISAGKLYKVNAEDLDVVKLTWKELETLVEERNDLLIENEKYKVDATKTQSKPLSSPSSSSKPPLSPTKPTQPKDARNTNTPRAPRRQSGSTTAATNTFTTSTAKVPTKPSGKPNPKAPHSPAKRMNTGTAPFKKPIGQRRRISVTKAASALVPAGVSFHKHVHELLNTCRSISSLQSQIQEVISEGFEADSASKEIGEEQEEHMNSDGKTNISQGNKSNPRARFVGIVDSVCKVFAKRRHASSKLYQGYKKINGHYFQVSVSLGIDQSTNHPCLEFQLYHSMSRSTRTISCLLSSTQAQETARKHEFILPLGLSGAIQSSQKDSEKWNAIIHTLVDHIVVGTSDVDGSLLPASFAPICAKTNELEPSDLLAARRSRFQTDPSMVFNGGVKIGSGYYSVKIYQNPQQQMMRTTAYSVQNRRHYEFKLPLEKIKSHHRTMLSRTLALTSTPNQDVIDAIFMMLSTKDGELVIDTIELPKESTQELLAAQMDHRDKNGHIIPPPNQYDIHPAETQNQAVDRIMGEIHADVLNRHVKSKTIIDPTTLVEVSSSSPTPSNSAVAQPIIDSSSQPSEVKTENSIETAPPTVQSQTSDDNSKTA